MEKYLKLIRDRINKDGTKETLDMIKSQNIQGPSASEFFGEEFGQHLKDIINSKNKS